jgi:hypothetical protein
MRRLLVWLAVLAVLGVGGWFGDAALRDQAQQRVAASLAEQLGATGVDVRLGGWPFAAALVTRTVPSTVIAARTASLDAGKKELALTDLTVTTGEVVLAGDELQASHVAGTATIDYRSLERLAGVPVEYAGNGRLGLSYRVALLGRTLTVAVSAKPVLDTGTATIQLTEPKADLNGTQVGLPIDQSVIDSLVKPIEVHLDYGLRVTGVTPAAEGLGIAFAADRASLPLT